MKYLIAISYTILLVLFPMIMIPILQWYKRTFLEQGTEMGGIYILLVLISFGLLILTIIKWVLAVKEELD
jgi:hypothetical protein